MKLSLSLALGLLFALLALASAAHPGFKVTLTESGASATRNPKTQTTVSPHHPNLNTPISFFFFFNLLPPFHFMSTMSGFLGHEPDQPEFSD
jgi:hypothetical protein